jgi:AcrR family transcriptional regulator
MVAAMVEISRERGVGEVTVAHVVARSGVSRRTFYEYFEGREACFLAALDEGIQRAAARVAPAFTATGTWRERIRGALGALLEFLEDEPGLGRLCVVDALGAGPRALARRADVVDVLIAAVEQGGEQGRGAAGAERLTAEGVVGAVLAVLHARLAAQENPLMTGLLGPLMAMIALPYLGRAAATREAARPAPARRHADPVNGNALRDLDLRLTYRTVRVLAAVAAHPGASNRLIADAAGVADQGQISKLLARLEHAGLVGNAAVGSGARGGPNVWALTAKGEGVARAIGERAVPGVMSA